ncbi:MAG: MGMT family protein [Candidatus Azobacteroides sp.]|nr:MGMT family protein [Candidatus Azobacteroides sp.]
MTPQEREEFTQAVYEVVKRIPYGRVTCYGAIAKAIGYPRMARLVGRIISKCNSDSSEPQLPAHRVVNNQGVLTGKKSFGNAKEMQRLLESERIRVINNKIYKHKRVFWDPLKEIQV